MGRLRLPVDVPLNYPCTTLFLDESGVKGTDRFTVAGFKVREVGSLSRAVKHIRDERAFYGEFKFSTLNDGSRDLAYALVDALSDSDAQIVGCVVDPSVFDPFSKYEHRWEAHVDVAAKLMVGCINRRELVCALIDGITTPRGVSMEEVLRRRVNHRLGSTSVVSALCLDSGANDLLQLADLVASSIAFERRRLQRGVGSPTSAKGLVAARVGAAFGNAGLLDGRGERFNIATYGSGRAPRLQVVPPTVRSRSA